MRAHPKPSRRVAIVTPLGSAPKLDDEKISLAHLHHYLSAYDKFMLCPEGVYSHHPGFQAKFFDHKYFGSVAAHCALQMSRDYFEAFADYEYILMYHLDSLVLSSELEPWLDRRIDYIGAPWIPCGHAPWVDKPRVGNGGFALFHVQHCLRVLNSRRYNLDPMNNLRHKIAISPSLALKIRRLPRAGLCWFHPFNGVRQCVRWHIRKQNSDLFWADDAIRFDPRFRVATLEEGLAFAFETEPRRCFEMTGGRMPFGAHAWARYDRSFWEPYLLNAKSTLAQAV